MANSAVTPTAFFYTLTPASQVRLDTTNGYGSSSTKVRRWSNTIQNAGIGITYADSATLGGTFTINQDGIYCCTISDNFSVANVQIGITLNSGALTTNISSQASGVVLAWNNGAPGDSAVSVSWSGKLVTGDIIRFMGDGSGTGSLPAAQRNVTVSQLYRLT